MNIQRLVKKLRKADAPVIDAVLATVLTRKMELYPEWEIIYFALSRESKESRKATVQAVMELIAQEQ